MVRKVAEHEKYYLTELDPALPKPEYRLARGRVGLYPKEQIPGEFGIVNLDNTLENLRMMEAEINRQLIGVEEAVHAILLGLVAGCNVHLRSGPGLAKSTMGRMIGEAMSGKFFRVNLNPDTSRNALFGSIDPEGIARGEWKRKWAGVAAEGVCVALFDEFGKGSPQVQNMLLDVMEERTVTEAGDERVVDLLIGISASNEYPEGFTRSAAWDRFALRIEMDYPGRSETWKKLLTSDSGKKPISATIDAKDVLLLQGLSDYVSMGLNGALVDTMDAVRLELRKKNIVASPRRMLTWKQVAVAQAMLEGGIGSEVNPGHFIVGKDILWPEPETILDVTNIVAGCVDPIRAEVLAAKADLEEIEKKTATVETAQELTRMLKTLRRWEKTLNKFPGHKEAAEVVERISEGQKRVMEEFGRISDNQKEG